MHQLEQRSSKFKYSAVLIREFVATDFKLRYQGSVLGYAWSLLKPLSLFAVLYFVFTQIIRFAGIENYPVYLLIGIVLWTFFTEVTTNSITSIANKSGLLRKIYFPRHTIVIAGSISALINLVFNSIIVAVLLVLTKTNPGLDVFFVLLVIIEIYMLSLGLAFFLSAAYVKYRDIKYVWQVVLQAGFYSIPIIYPITLVDAKSVALSKVVMLNPVAQVIQDARSLILGPNVATLQTYFSSPFIRVVPFLICLGVLLAGYSYFKKSSDYFAEIA